MGEQVAGTLAKKFGTKVSVGRVDLGFLNRIIIDDVSILDQQNKPLLKASRISAKIDYWLLCGGKVVISSAQLFGMHANLYQQSADVKPNFSFLLDSLASKDTTGSAAIDMKIGSLIVRHSSLAYNRWDVATPHARFSPDHVDLTDISAHIILNVLKRDTLSLNVKKLALKERSGLQLKALSFKLSANARGAVVKNLHIVLPHSELSLGEMQATYSVANGKMLMPMLQFSGSIERSKLFLPDVAALLPRAPEWNAPIQLSVAFSGTSTSLNVRSINLETQGAKLFAKGWVNNWSATPRWFADVRLMNVASPTIEKFTPANRNIEPLMRFGNIAFVGNVGGYGNDVAAKGHVRTNAGNANFVLGVHGKRFAGRLETQGLDLRKVLNNDSYGVLSTKIHIGGMLLDRGREIAINARGEVSQFTFNGYNYRNINIDAYTMLQGKFRPVSFNGMLSVDDPNGRIELKGNIFKNARSSFNLSVRRLNPGALKLFDGYKGKVFGFDAAADFEGNNINDAIGNLNISNFNMTSPETIYYLNAIDIVFGMKEQEHFISMNSDFGNAYLQGRFNMPAVLQNLKNTIISKLPGIQTLLPVKYEKIPDVNIKLTAEINNAEWMEKLLDIPVQLHKPLRLAGSMNSKRQYTDVTLRVPDMVYNSSRYANGLFHITTSGDTLKTMARVRKYDAKRHPSDWYIRGAAVNDNLITSLSFNNRSRNRRLKGQLNAETKFFKNANNESAAHITVHPSEILVGDTTWHVQPSDMIYSKHHVTIDHFAVNHNNQHIIVNGIASKSASDSIAVDLKDIDVNYILDFVNFHSVEFSGLATGKAYLYAPFGDPHAKAHLQVADFKFQNGCMGTLYASADWTQKENQINIDAQTVDGSDKITVIKGFVSPAKNYIDLAIDAHRTRLEFVQDFCKSFMRDVDATGEGRVRVSGNLSNINLTGEVVANGSLGVKSLNTWYTMRGVKIRFEPDDIVFYNNTVYDRNGNVGILNGHVYHKHLTNLSFEFDIKGENILAYDTRSFGENTFYGTVYVTGDCRIKGKSGEVIIDVKATLQKGSQIVYNAASPDAINKHDFIRWTAKPDTVRAIVLNTVGEIQPNENTEITPNIPGDLHVNFHIDCNQNLTFKLMMDSQTGDYIALNGDGILQANYYNKGGFDMFGNYIVDHGIYKLTIQNVIKKDFMFERGGTIAFGGNPYNAVLNLKADYMVNGVSLADLKIGRSFTNNNIRVNCLMNIGGTPSQPRIDFALDMPTVSNDMKQMVYSLINSEEEMNQQVLYLLAIGRFYSQRQNNAITDNSSQQSQTNLAMQSLLSGTVSQQINNVLSSVVNNPSWNFGANISTGTEGWYNAEYEGLLNGRLLNNRLLINGQFGYRDNANTTTSFIGDFDVRYLLFPNGNMAIKVYNQTNDRYFTRNSMNTQGVGIILKKDFNGLRDLFGRKRKNK